MVELRRINLNTAWTVHEEEVTRMEEILREELTIVVNREFAISRQEIDVTETIRTLAESFGVCPFEEEEESG